MAKLCEAYREIAREDFERESPRDNEIMEPFIVNLWDSDNKYYAEDDDNIPYYCH